MLCLREFLLFSVIFATVYCGEVKHSKLQLEILEEHNKLRRLHQAGDLVLDPELCEGAQKEAERKLEVFKTTGLLGPNPEDADDRSYNDNTLAYRAYSRKTWTGKRVLQDWILQGKNHTWEDNYFRPYSGHFTQMIWGSTEAIGVGNATGRDGQKHYLDVWVIRYSPPGNILDRDTFAENVMPPKPYEDPKQPIMMVGSGSISFPPAAVSAAAPTAIITPASVAPDANAAKPHSASELAPPGGKDVLQ